MYKNYCQFHFGAFYGRIAWRWLLFIITLYLKYGTYAIWLIQFDAREFLFWPIESLFCFFFRSWNAVLNCTAAFDWLMYFIRFGHVWLLTSSWFRFEDWRILHNNLVAVLLNTSNFKLKLSSSNRVDRWPHRNQMHLSHMKITKVNKHEQGR